MIYRCGMRAGAVRAKSACSRAAHGRYRTQIAHKRSFKMPLSIAPQGAAVEIKRISAEDRVKRHLSDLGITAGARVTVLSSDGGNVILLVKEGRLCLDRTLASHIMVAMAA